MRSVFLCTTAMAIAAAIAPAVAAGVTDDDVQAAINRGVKYLLNRQKPDGLFADKVDFPHNPAGGAIHGGEDCWVMVGLAVAGLDPNRDSMKKGLDAIMKFDLDKTYAVAARIIALCRVYHKLDRDRMDRVRAAIVKDLLWLKTAQGAEGQWDYGSLGNKPSDHWDLSNTQMAILALSEADMAGFDLPAEMLLRTQKLYLEWQNEDDGWAYGNRPLGGNMKVRDSYGSMTAAAVASLYITRDYLYRDLGCPCSSGRSKLRPDEPDRAIRRGLEWLGRNFKASQHFYWLYSCERVGLAAGLKYFGAHDWYSDGATVCVRTQRPDGSWKQIGNDYGTADTVFAICFLVKGRAPILFNKLQFNGQWDNHPRDVSNLVKYVSHQKEQPIQWQVINLEAPVEEWHDAPILYISAETPIPLTDEHRRKLRRYTDTGGTILFEASCGAREVKTWWEKTAREIWPEWELKKLDKDHPVRTADQKILRPLPYMEEMSDGVRTIIFYSPGDISCAWNGMAVSTRGEVFSFGTNLYVYATDRRPLRARLARKKEVAEGYRDARLTAGPRSNLAVARVKHGGDYYVGRNYDPWGLFAAAVKEKCGLTVTDAGEKRPEELKPADVQVAYLVGRQGLALNDAELKALGDYVAGGGFLFVEAALGDKRFDAAVQPLFKAMGLEDRRIPPDHGLVTGKLPGSNGCGLTGVKYKPALMADRLGSQVPELIGLYRDDRLAGVYSPFDLVYAQTTYNAWANRGYADEDALAILTNIFLLVSSR